MFHPPPPPFTENDCVDEALTKNICGLEEISQNATERILLQYNWHKTQHTHSLINILLRLMWYQHVGILLFVSVWIWNREGSWSIRVSGEVVREAWAARSHVKEKTGRWAEENPSRKHWNTRWELGDHVGLSFKFVVIFNSGLWKNDGPGLNWLVHVMKHFLVALIYWPLCSVVMATISCLSWLWMLHIVLFFLQLWSD